MADITLGDVMSAINSRATETKLADVDTRVQTLLSHTDGLEGLLADIRDSAGIKRIVDAIDIADRAGRVLGKVSADDGAIAALGALAAAAVTDPTAAASVIALLKGLLRQLQGAGTGSMPVTLNGSNMLVDGETIVASAGTPVPLATSQPAREVLVQAKLTNVGNVMVGDVSPNIILTPGAQITISINDPAKVYVDAATSGDGVNWVVVQ